MKKIPLLMFLLLGAMVSNPAVSQTLVHYWNFNNSGSVNDLLTPSFTLAGNPALTHIPGGISAIPVTGNTGQGFDVANENARNGDPVGTHLRFNDPIGAALEFVLPTTGYKDIVIKYTSRRSGQGAGAQYIAYTTDGTNFTLYDTILPVDGNPVLEEIDFSAVTAANGNANFGIRITFAQGPGGTTGNNRFDNFTLEGTSLSPNDITPPTALVSPANNAVNVAINSTVTFTFSEDVRLVNDVALDNSNADSLVELRMNDSAGTPVSFDATYSNRVLTITPAAALANNQVYYALLKADRIEDLSNNSLAVTTETEFTTIALQTVFQPGDLVPVAYRMSATATEDAVALLTLVDILPGTIINLTDAKYTINAQAQCPGGLSWTAPAGGIAAGTVIVLENDVPTVSAGSIAGAKFGLSSGGDQLIVYTGTAAAPAYITALSSNAWINSNTVCNGSESMIPAPLTNGQSAINLSTAPGNTAGNTPNAFYNGIQTGTPAQLKAAVLDAANWVGAAGGTAPQTWPTWAFPGPPSVIKVTVMNQTTLQVIFNRNLDNVSATDVANYTGIAGLSTVTISNNGTLADTLTLSYSTPFVPATANTLTIAHIKDTDNRNMFTPHVFTFSYNTTIAFVKNILVVNEDAGTVTVNIQLNNPTAASVNLALKPAPYSNATAGSDFTYATQTLQFTGSSNSLQSVTIPIANDNTAEQDEYFVLSLENATGGTISGSNLLTVYIKDNDRKAPAPSKQIELSHVSSFDPSPSQGSTTEIVVHDPVSQRLFTTSAIQKRLDISDFSNPASITIIKSVDMTPYGGITSVSVKNGIVAVASPNANEQLNGTVVFFNTNGDFQKQVTVGALPDMITFSPDGSKVLTANEGQPNDAYTVDPEGTVSVIDISGGIATLDQSKVTTLDFTAFNAQENALKNAGVRKLKATSTLSQDFEPEYVTISPDSKKAWVTLQENNAIAEINLQNNTITGVWPLGTKDFNAFGNGFDASDKSGTALISNWPVKAFHIPDAVANYSIGGTNYIITANEGDEKEYAGLTERTTVADANLDPAVYPHADFLKAEHNLGRLRMTNLHGDTDGDGDFDQIFVNGSRSFSIFNADTRTRIYDSGDDFEKFTSTDTSIAALFNADNENNSFKSRSRAKGPEPEGLTIATISGQTFAFVALERVGGIMVYNITDPANVTFVDYKNSRSLTAFAGDHGPEGIIYIPAASSPDGKAYLAVANEISGTVSVFEVKSNLQETSVQFASAATAVVENAGTHQVVLPLAPQAVIDGQVIIKVTSGADVTAADYTTIPAMSGDSIVIPLPKNATQVSFSVIIADDTLAENDETISFEILSVSGGFVKGPGSSFLLTIADNDGGVGIAELPVASLHLYPNPVTQGMVYFDRAITATLTDVSGKMLRSVTDSREMNVKGLAAGTYFIRTNEGATGRIVIR